jgi:hypothetical protein
MHTLGGKPLKLNATHNRAHGKAQVIWRGLPANVPPAITGKKAVISGGIQLTKWYACDDGIHCPWPEWHGVWVSAMADAPAALKPFIPLRQLWVNGATSVRASATATGLGLKATATGFTSQVDIPWYSTAVAQQVELRWPQVIRNWIEPRCVLTAATARSLTVAPGCWAALIAQHAGELPPPPIFVDNAIDGRIHAEPSPPGPGEFISTPAYLFYRPPAADPYGEPASAWAAAQETLLDGNALANHSFVNLTFSHATWRQPSTDAGYVPSQSMVTAGEPWMMRRGPGENPAAMYGWGEPVGSVNITRSRGVEFDGTHGRVLSPSS